MTGKHDVIDEDGNVIQPPTPDHPVMAIVWLLEYGRKRGFKIGPRVQVGDTIVEVGDLRQAAANARDSNREPELVPGSDFAVVMGVGDE